MSAGGDAGRLLRVSEAVANTMERLNRCNVEIKLDEMLILLPGS